MQSLPGLSLEDDELMKSLDGIREVVKEKTVLFKKVRLARLGRMAELSEQAQLEKDRFERGE